MRAYTNPDLTIMAAYDPNSLGNISVFRTTHVTLDVALDFEKSVLAGTVTLRLLSLSDNEAVTKQVILDSRYVDVQEIETNGEILTGWSLGKHTEPYGSPLTIPLNEAVKLGREIDLKVGRHNQIDGITMADPGPHRSNSLRPTSAQHCNGWHLLKRQTRSTPTCV